MLKRLAFGRLSITARLTLLYSAVSLAVMSGVGWHLYQVLEAELAERDQRELTGKVALVRNLLQGADAAGVLSPKRWEDVFVGHHGLHFSLLDERLRVLIATSDFRLPEQALAAVRATPDEGVRSMDWRGADRRSYRLTSAWSRLGSSGPPVLIVLALDRTEHQQFAALHAKHVLAAVALGTLVAGALGYTVSRLGLDRVREIADAASAITASDLERRLDVERSPKELKPLSIAFNQMLQRLQDSFRRLSDFSSDIAHELRTPLANILGQTQVALSQQRGVGELREVLESNVEELERLARMVDDMLFLARADNAQAVLNREPFGVREEIDKVASFFELLCDEQGVRVELRGDAQVLADRALIRRALSNLFSNALRHTPRGGSIRIDAKGSTDGATEIVFSNDGDGIPRHHGERIFDRFYRADAARAGADGGAGLGLAIVKSVMSLHGGDVTLHTAPAQPTTFTLHLPRFPD